MKYLLMLLALYTFNLFAQEKDTVVFVPQIDSSFQIPHITQERYQVIERKYTLEEIKLIDNRADLEHFFCAVMCYLGTFERSDTIRTIDDIEPKQLKKIKKSAKKYGCGIAYIDIKGELPVTDKEKNFLHEKYICIYYLKLCRS